MEKYSSYKDSGVKWLGEIPSHWEMVRLRYLCRIKTGDKDTINRDENGKYPFYVRSPKVERINSYTYDGEAVLMAGDGVGAGKVFHYVNGKFGCHQRVYIINNIEKVNGKFLYYYMQSKFKYVIEQLSAKSTVDSVRLNMLQDFNVLIPSLKEQLSIIKYIEFSVYQIDTAIEQQKKMIELLNERKQIIINNAVTKGLDPNVKMKDSGVDWIGEIPSHWTLLPGLAVMKENKEKNSNLEYNTVLSLSYGKIIIKKDINEGLVPAEYNTYQIVKSGYIVIRCTDLQNDKTSLRTGLVKNEGIISSASVGLVIDAQNNPSYIHYFLHAWDITKELYRHGSGLRQSLSWLDLKRLPILIPSRTEQDAIVSYLDSVTTQIDTAISQQKKMIELLNERKQIIINEVVTGKVKVS